MATIAEALALAVRHHQAGALPQAEQLYRQILQIDPAHVDALHLLGILASQTGRHLEAVGYIRQSLARNPQQPEAHNNLGIALRNQSRLDEAVACFRQAVLLKPDYAEAYSNLGMAYQEQRRLDEAVACLRQALTLKPDFAKAHSNLGLVYKEQGLPDEAVACYRQSLRLNPDYAEAHNNLGNILQAQGLLDEAVACYRQALLLKPDHAEAHNNLGVTLQVQGRLDEAVACCREALRLKPDYGEAYNNLGIALREQGRLDEAAACIRHALRLQPDNADAHFNLFVALLLQGDFEQGWPQYEWRLRCQGKQPRPFRQPRWDGSPLLGRTLLLHAEQGLGDTLQFIRYASRARQCGGTVLVECPSVLVRLLEGVAGIDRLIATGTPLPSFDVQAPLMSLPGLFGTTLDTIPAEIPYLRANPECIQRWRRELEPWGGFRVGIVWQGNPEYRGDRHRSPPLAHFAPLAGVAGVRLFSLQKGAGSEQLPALAERLGVVDLGPRLDSDVAFLDSAAVMQNLDLVVTSDTAVAHLAGGLGVPVWVALPFVPDWRWLLERQDSPWYPSMRLFRQERPGDWDGVFARLADALRQLVQESA